SFPAPAPHHLSTLSLHDALPIFTPLGLLAPGGTFGEDKPGSLNLGKYGLKAVPVGLAKWNGFWRHAVLGGYGFSSGNHPVIGYRSEEHTSELQSRENLVCRLLLE